MTDPKHMDGGYHNLWLSEPIHLCRYHVDEMMSRWQTKQRASKLHKAYRGKKKSW